MRRSEIPNCNSCGETLAKRYRTTDDGWGMYGLKIVASGEYASPVLHDGMTYTFHLCEGCIARLMANFVVQPIVSGYDISTGEPAADPQSERGALKALDELRGPYQPHALSADESDQGGV